MLIFLAFAFSFSVFSFFLLSSLVSTRQFHRTAPHRTAPHRSRTAPHVTAPHPTALRKIVGQSQKSHAAADPPILHSACVCIVSHIVVCVCAVFVYYVLSFQPQFASSSLDWSVTFLFFLFLFSSEIRMLFPSGASVHLFFFLLLFFSSCLRL